MTSVKSILVVGTADTKSAEIGYLSERIEALGGRPLVMDVGVLGEPALPVDFSKHAVAEAAGTTNQAIIDLGDENRAMAKTAEGAVHLATSLAAKGEIDGIVILGGTMGTDLALDVCDALPMGFPKMVVSTVAFSPLLPPERIAADVMMILWAGGLYGLNSICKSSLSQAAGAVLGAAQAVERPQRARPVVAMTSLGSSSLKYMKRLKRELESRGYEVAIFHTTGMGGRAMENLAAKGTFACVMDLALVEVSNHVHGSVVSAGTDRLEAAGRAGIPQIIAPGGVSLIDMRAWAEPPADLGNREIHAHNRLIACALMTAEEKRAAARAVVQKLRSATGPTAFIMPLRGIDEWDRPGGPFHAPDGLSAIADEMRAGLAGNGEFIELDAHINDEAFAEAVLELFDRWRAEGLVSQPGDQPERP